MPLKTDMLIGRKDAVFKGLIVTSIIIFLIGIGFLAGV